MARSPAATEHEDVTVTGPKNAPPLVFVHGTVFNRTMWAPQREALAEEFRVITPELPGHGTRANESFTLAEGVKTLDRVIDDLTAGSAHVVGLSLGGYVATAYASRNPDAVDDLILSGSSANPVGLLGGLTRLTGEVTARAAQVGPVERATDWLTARYVRSRDLNPSVEREIVDAGFDLEPFGEAGRAIAGVDFRSGLADYPGAVLVCNGQRDLVMRLGERAHANAGDADREVIEGAGHVCNLDEADEYTAAVRRFVDPVIGATASD